MKLIDRYVLAQLAGPFLFFALIFGGILWLNQALRIVDVVISNGQPGIVFAELSAYLLPKAMETVTPVAAFAAAIYLANRLYAESELVVMMGAGIGPARATRPYLVFGLFCALLMVVLTQVVTPFALGLFNERQHQISREFLTQFVVAGAFSSPAPGVTVFFGETTPEGAISDVLIHDTRGRDEITHTATRGQVISDPEAPKLILFDGMIQRYSPETEQLGTIQFETLSYDLGQFAKAVSARRISTAELHGWELLGAGPRAAAQPAAQRMIEFHHRVVKALLSIVVPVLGAMVLLSAGFSRAGFLTRIALGVVFMVAVNAMRGAVEPLVGADGSGWPALYLPVVLAFGAVFLLVRVGEAPWKTGLRGVVLGERAVR